MTYVLRWRPASTGIPAMLRFQEKHDAFDQACTLLSAREQNVEVYENGKLVPMAVIRAYRDSRRKAAPENAPPTPSEGRGTKRR